jgi:hypothetical protein
MKGGAGDYPSHFNCPITHDVMKDPVTTVAEIERAAASGGEYSARTYERAAIEKWVSQERNDPLTREPLLAGDLVPNEALKIEMWEAGVRHGLLADWVWSGSWPDWLRLPGFPSVPDWVRLPDWVGLPTGGAAGPPGGAAGPPAPASAVRSPRGEADRARTRRRIGAGPGGARAGPQLPDSCGICSTRYGDRPITSLQCRHEFHTDCIGRNWSEAMVWQCPLCGLPDPGVTVYPPGAAATSTPTLAHDQPDCNVAENFRDWAKTAAGWRELLRRGEAFPRESVLIKLPYLPPLINLIGKRCRITFWINRREDNPQGGVPQPEQQIHNVVLTNDNFSWTMKWFNERDEVFYEVTVLTPDAYDHIEGGQPQIKEIIAGQPLAEPQSIETIIQHSGQTMEEAEITFI